MFWNYSFGQESMPRSRRGSPRARHHREGRSRSLPTTEFQANPPRSRRSSDAVFVFFAGAAPPSSSRITDAGLRDKIPLYAAASSPRACCGAQGAAAEGIKTTLHYADQPRYAGEQKVPRGVQEATSRDADVYAVAGYGP